MKWEGALTCGVTEVALMPPPPPVRFVACGTDTLVCLDRHSCLSGQTGVSVLHEVLPEPRVRLVARATQLAALDAILHLAVRLVHVRAVRETAELRRLDELREVVAQR